MPGVTCPGLAAAESLRTYPSGPASGTGAAHVMAMAMVAMPGTGAPCQASEGWGPEGALMWLRMGRAARAAGGCPRPNLKRDWLAIQLEMAQREPHAIRVKFKPGLLG